MTYDYEIGDGAHALDQQQELDYARGYQVIDAAGGSNLVDDNGTSDLVIRASSGDINAGGTTVSCTQQTVDLAGDVDPDDPRKVTVYRTTAGTLDYVAGVAEPAQGGTRRGAYRPAPPTLSGTDGVVLATVWVGAGVSSITNSDIRDRRLPAELNVAALSRDIDAQGNDITGLGSVSTGQINASGQVTATQGGDKAIVSKGDGFVGMALESYRDSSSDHGIFNFYSSRGTETSPAAIQSGDRIATIRPRSYDGSSFESQGDIRAEATEDVTSGAAGQKWVFAVNPQGTLATTPTAEVTETGIVTIPTGSATDPAVKIGPNGAGLFVNGSGEVVVVDEAGNTTVLS